jgi:CRP-like cAMP-binding protein
MSIAVSTLYDTAPPSIAGRSERRLCSRRMADNVEFLKHVRLFEDLDRRSLEAIANAAVEQSYTVGQDIVRQGDTGVGAFIIKKGRVEAFQDRGGHIHKLAEMKQGDVFGEMALLDEFPRSATVRALEPTVCLGIQRWHFRGILESHPQIALALLPVLTKRLRNAEREDEASAKH